MSIWWWRDLTRRPASCRCGHYLTVCSWCRRPTRLERLADQAGMNADQLRDMLRRRIHALTHAGGAW